MAGNASERFSFLGMLNPTIKHIVPSGSVNITSRANLVDLYSGIQLAGGPSLQSQWDYNTNIEQTLVVETSIKSLEVKLGM